MIEDNNLNTNEYPNENVNDVQEDEFQDEFALAKHSLKRKRIERKIRKKRKKVKQLKSFLRFVSFIVVIFLGYYFLKLPQWYLPKDTFSNLNSKNIEIINNDIVPDYVMRKSMKNLYVPKLPIFLVKVNPIKKELFKIPVIKNIYVRRYGFPARIQIIVRERVPIAVIKTDLKAKTGTLKDVSSIAGYLKTKKGNKYTFCIIINDPSSTTSDMKTLEDYLIREAYIRL